MRKVHFIGVGGIGMSALADILSERGVIVSGSDLRPNDLTKKLLGKGVVVQIGHRPENIPPDVDVIVKSTCIKDDNPEIKESLERNIRVISRSDLLKDIIDKTPISVGITGTHGKTTTSGLISYITDVACLDPTLLIGGEMKRFGGNSRAGLSGLLVAEVDESDGLFRDISVTNAVITNIEREHMEHYGSMREVSRAYRSYTENISGGVLAFNGDDRVLRDLVSEVRVKKVSYGLSRYNDVSCIVYEHKRRIIIDLLLKGDRMGQINSSLIGLHNVSNILAASAMALHIGIDLRDIIEGIRLFDGVKRRFDTVGRVGSITVIEDYAHHPTELRSVIRAAKDFSDGRVIAVFQPHRYTRTMDLSDDFAACFNDADILLLTEIYSADEDPLTGSDITRLFNSIDKTRFSDVGIWEKANMPEKIATIAREKDTILILGAGDIRDISGEVTEALRKNRSSGVPNVQ